MSDLAQKLRNRSRFKSGLDRNLLRAAARTIEALSEEQGEGEASLAEVLAHFEHRGISLLPWQRKKLGVESEEGTGS